MEIASDNDIRTIWSEQIGSDFLAQMFVYSRKSARIESVIKAGDFKILPELRPGRVEISFLFYRNGYKKPQFRLTLWLDEDGDYVTERLTGGVFS
ncbi:MAG: hypothetical protein KGI66_04400 [Patescibacteria group bacterium]|nr:hypothetical protein [Patescibacteria group bacterium]